MSVPRNNSFMESSVMLEIDMDLRLMAGIRRRNCDGAFKRQGAGAQEASGGACTAVVTTLIQGGPTPAIRVRRRRRTRKCSLERVCYGLVGETAKARLA